MNIKPILVALAIAAVGVSARTPPQAATPNDAWPPAGVHKPGEPGLTLPVIVDKTQPAYTSQAMRAKLQGFVVIAAVIGADGKVGQTRIIQSLDPVFGLDDAAVTCVKQWRFSPGTKDGVAVPIAVNFDIGFSLHDVPPPSTWPRSLSNDGPDPATRGSLEGIRSMAISAPRKVPVDWTLPMPIPLLQRFADLMRDRGATRFRDTMGVGQLSIGGLWWVWLDLIAAPSAMSPMLVLPNGDPAGLRLWSFTTTVNAYEVNISYFAVSLAGIADAARDEELRAAGRDFRNIMSALTISKKIAYR